MNHSTAHAIVVGAGLVGAVQALLLARAGYRVTVIEQRRLQSKDVTKDPLSTRTVALSARSWQLLDGAGLWPAIPGCPIKTVHVSEQGRFGSVKIHAHKLNVDALGFVVSNSDFEANLLERLRSERGIELIEEATAVSIEQTNEKVSLVVVQHGKPQTIDADVLVAADGTSSVIRGLLDIDVKQHDYQQCAVLANVASSIAHSFEAFERFTKDGPLALLPLMGEPLAGESVSNYTGSAGPGSAKSCFYSMILTSSTENTQTLKELSDDKFLHLLQKKFGGKLGRFKQLGPRTVIPLNLSVSSQQTLGRCVLVGNASRTLHPVSGQGLNLALRDVFELASCLQQHPDASRQDTSRHDTSAGVSNVSHALSAFSTNRRRDQKLVTAQTDVLARAFTDKPFPLRLPISAARHASLLLLDFADPVKKTFATLNMGQHVSLPS